MRVKGFAKAICLTTIRILSCLMLIGTLTTPVHAASSAISPSSLNFGTQAVGSTSAPKSVTFTNNGRRRVSIRGIYSSAAPFTYSGSSFPVTLYPGQSLTGTVTFRPGAAQTYSGRLVFTFSTGWKFSADLSGTGVQEPSAAVAPSITTQPVSKTVTAGQTATFSVAASGTASLAYQWKKNSVNISGATSSSYTTPATTTSDNGAQFTVTVSNSAGYVTSSAATLTVNAAAVAPSITTQPVSQTVTAGQTATFSVVASSTAPMTYLWRKNNAAIRDATSSSYTTPAATTSDNGAQYSVTVGNSAGYVTSSAATLTVNAAAVAPSITSQPVSQTVTAGQTATFSVAASGTAPLTYQWKKNNVNISGATSSSYTTPATTTSDSGAQFTVTVSNSAGNVTSSPATLTVNAAPSALSTSSTSLSFGSINLGSSSSLSATLTNSGSSSITILGVSVSGAGFTPSGVSSGLILNGGSTATLNVVFAPAATGSVTGSVTITSTATNPTLTINLSGTGVQLVPHTVTLNWSPSTSTVSGYYVYRTTVSGSSYAPVTSSPMTSTQFTDSTVQSGQTYYYVVTAVNPSNVQSSYSNQATAIVP